MGVDGLTQFLKTNLKNLECKNSKLRVESKSKCDQLVKLQKEYEQICSEKQKWFQRCSQNKGQISALEHQLYSLKSETQTKSSENDTLHKEIEKMRREIALLQKKEAKTEPFISETVRNSVVLKDELSEIQYVQNNLREEHICKINALTAEIKRLEKQKQDILNGFKRQMYLVDNVQKQKAHVEVLKSLEVTQSEFMKMFDGKLKKEIVQ